MCGIVGYIGNKQAISVLIPGLERLEYRGYDSAGVCVHSGKTLQVKKAKGRLENLKEMLKVTQMPGILGIGHTRWATHGEPTDRNSHPHLSCSGRIALVHNGIIENEVQLRAGLIENGFQFSSETDTEVVANLIEYHYRVGGDLVQAVLNAVRQLEGSFALGILSEGLPDTLIAVKKDSPLMVGLGEQETMIASDVTALLPYTQKVVDLEDRELAIMTPMGVCYMDFHGRSISKQPGRIGWQPEFAQRDGYNHFMLKEIFQQPNAVRDTIRAGLLQWKQKPEKIWFVACGSAYHVALLGQYTIRQYCRIPSEAMIASEFRYSDSVLRRQELVILISQSGETADTIGALKKAKEKGCETWAMVNVVGCTLSKLADRVVYSNAGPEIAVATTKAFSAQLAQLWMLTASILQEDHKLQQQIFALPELIQNMLAGEMVERCRSLAKRFKNANSVYYIGRNTDYCICLEGSLKLKEVAYLHCEAYPAGELKHGPIAMIQPGTLVVALVTIEELAGKTISNIREVQSRGAEVLCIVRESLCEKLNGLTAHMIMIPDTHPMLQPSLSVLPLQVFAYYVAVGRGCDVDKPRNLAKSVTVE